MSLNFDYYKLELKLVSDMLGTCTEASIYQKHILKKTQKNIEEAHKLANKSKKAFEKYVGTELSEQKELQELHAVIRRYQEIVGRREEIPTNTEKLFQYIETIKADFDEKVKQGDEQSATCFMRDQDGKACISTHMILGNLKANLKALVNGGDKTVIKSKVAVGEIMALDVKPVEAFCTPSMDIERWEDGRPKLLERPIRFDRMGKQEVAIAQSEVLPAGSEFSMHLRVRKGSPLTLEYMEKLFDLGKSHGLGQWRGSGMKGAYVYRLNLVPHFKENIPEGWN